MHIRDAQVGQTVEFHYSGGTEAGPRLVRVTSTAGNGLHGIDLSKGEPRQYLHCKCDEAEVVADIGEHVIMPGEFLSEAMAKADIAGDKLVAMLKLLRDDIETAYYHKKFHCLVVTHKAANAVFILADGDEITLRFVNDRGENLDLKLRTTSGRHPDRLHMRAQLDSSLMADMGSKVAAHLAKRPPSKSPYLDQVQKDILSGRTRP